MRNESTIKPNWTIWSSKFQKEFWGGALPRFQLFLGLRHQISGVSRPRFDSNPQLLTRSCTLASAIAWKTAHTQFVRKQGFKNFRQIVCVYAQLPSPFVLATVMDIQWVTVNFLSKEIIFRHLHMNSTVSQILAFILYYILPAIRWRS